MKRHGLRREAKRHAAFARPTRVKLNNASPPLESGVAAALCHRTPKRWRGYPAPRVREASWSASSPLALSPIAGEAKGFLDVKSGYRNPGNQTPFFPAIKAQSRQKTPVIVLNRVSSRHPMKNQCHAASHWFSLSRHALTSRARRSRSEGERPCGSKRY